MKKRSLFTGLGLTWLGAMVLLNNLGKPRVEALHGSDVLGIMASGFCFGGAFVILLIGYLPGKTLDKWRTNAPIANSPIPIHARTPIPAAEQSTGASPESQKG